MAQWTGQYSGNTHASKVRDREQKLQHAIEVYRAQPSKTARAAQVANVLRLAEQLLQARVRLLKARFNALPPLAPDSPLAKSWFVKIEDMEAGGVNRILEEFQVGDLAEG